MQRQCCCLTQRMQATKAAGFAKDRNGGIVPDLVRSPGSHDLCIGKRVRLPQVCDAGAHMPPALKRATRAGRSVRLASQLDQKQVRPSLLEGLKPTLPFWTWPFAAIAT